MIWPPPANRRCETGPHRLPSAVIGCCRDVLVPSFYRVVYRVGLAWKKNGSQKLPADAGTDAAAAGVAVVDEARAASGVGGVGRLGARRPLPQHRPRRRRVDAVQPLDEAASRPAHLPARRFVIGHRPTAKQQKKNNQILKNNNNKITKHERLTPISTPPRNTELAQDSISIEQKEKQKTIASLRDRRLSLALAPLTTHSY